MHVLHKRNGNVSLTPTVICLLQMLQSSLITAGQIKCWIDQDPILPRVLTLVSKGWIEVVEDKLRPYQQHKDKTSILEGCILQGSRVVRAPVLGLLHGGHPGITKIKSIAREVVWWPNIDSDHQEGPRVRILPSEPEGPSYSPGTCMGMAKESMGLSPQQPRGAPSREDSY